MRLKDEKGYISTCIQTALLLSVLSLCPNVYADGEFSYFDLKEIPASRLANPIYLDTSKIKKTETDIPYNLRGNFDEGDYFSSTTMEIPAPSLPPANFDNIPAPSEYFSSDNKTAQSEEISKSASAEDSYANDFFAPPEINIGELEENSVADNPQKDVVESLPVQDFVNTATVNTSDIELEGKLVSQIKISGLRTISPEFVLEQINTQNGSLFSTEILQQDLQKIYATGYFSDNMSVEPILNSDQTLELTFFVEENMTVQDTKIIGNTVLSASELMPFVQNMKGKPQNLTLINNSIKDITSCYHNRGYILANVSSVDDDADGNLSFTILEGIINAINISGNEKTKDYVITRNIMTQPETVYNEEYLKKDLSKIYATQIFETVDRTITPCSDNGRYDVTVNVKEKVTNSVALGGGIDTGLGLFGSLGISDDNFLGRAQKVSLSGIIGSGILLSDASIKNYMNYQAELSFFEPYFLNADNSLMAKLYFKEMGSWNIPLAIEQRIGFKTGVEHKVEGYENLTTSFTAGIEHIYLKEGDYNRISQLYAEKHLNIADRANQLTGGFFINLTPGIKYSNLDDKEVPRDGVIAKAQFMEAVGVSDIHHTNGRLAGSVTKFFPVFKKSTFSITGKAGIKVHGDNMPEIMAFRLGGPYTIRGYRMNAVGAGDSFVMGSAELATPLPFMDKVKWDIFNKMRLTFFVDAGRVFDPISTNILYDRPLKAISAGVGLRIYIPGIGPMSVDYGLPITNPEHYGSKNGYFTFGSGGLNDYYGY